MDNNDIKQAVFEELSKNGITVDSTDDDVSLLSLGMDTQTFITFLVSLEDRFQVLFPDKFLTKEVMSSLNTLANLVENLLSKQITIESLLHGDVIGKEDIEVT